MNLKKYFDVPRKGKLHAVDDVSFEVYPGETLGLVGESGCGKSTVGNVIMRLTPRTDGQFFYRGRNIFTDLTNKLELAKKMQIIFQDPYSSLNPRKTVDKILSEPYIIQKSFGTKAELRSAVIKLCDLVEMPYHLLDRYPHELDGGMRQVVGIARALSLDSDFIICDEPVSALDVSVQARIINLLMDIQKKLNLSYLFISHDMSVVRHISNRIAIMYLGQIVETAETDEIFGNALHPYAISMLSAVPQVSTDSKVSRIVLKGDVPSPMNPGTGCRFAPRCWMACDDCFANDQVLTEVKPGHFTACSRYAQSRELAKAAETATLA